MAATGVPPTLVTANQMLCLSGRVENLQQEPMKCQESMLSTIIEKITTMPDTVANHLRNNLEIDGAVHVQIVPDMQTSLLKASAAILITPVEAQVTDGEAPAPRHAHGTRHSVTHHIPPPRSAATNAPTASPTTPSNPNVQKASK